MLLLLYSVRSVLARRATSIATVIGITTLVFTLGGTFMLLAGIRKSLDDRGDPRVAVVMGSGAATEAESSWESATAQAVLAEAGILNPADHVEEVVSVLDLPHKKRGRVTTIVRGIPEGGEKFRRNLRVVEGRMANFGGAEIVMGQGIRNRLGLELGSEIEFRKNLKATIVGFFTDGGSFHESELFVGRDFLQQAFSRQGYISTSRIRFSSAAQVSALREKLAHEKRFGQRVFSEPEFLERIGSTAGEMVKVLGIGISLLIGAAAGLGVAMTMFGSTAQRRREIGLLRALGFKRKQILTTFLLEPLVFGVVSGVLGSLMAIGLRSVDFSVAGEEGGELAVKFSLGVGPLLMASTIAIVICVLGGFLPALLASRVPPVTALRG